MFSCIYVSRMVLYFYIHLDAANSHYLVRVEPRPFIKEEGHIN